MHELISICLGGTGVKRERGMNMDKDIRIMEMGRDWPTKPLPLSPALDLDAMAQRIEEEKKKVFSQIDAMRDEAIAFLQDMVRIKSINPSEASEKELADFIAKKMRELKMEVQQIEPETNRTSNLAFIRGTKGDKTLLFDSHLDTVTEGTPENWNFPPFGAKIADGRLYGRGSKDCKLGMAASLMALQAIERAGVTLKGNCMIGTTADEETGGHKGIAQFIDMGAVKADYCIYCEGSPDRLTIGARGLCAMEITTHGKTTHSASKQHGINAIVKMASVIKAIDSMTFTNWQPHPIVPGGPTASVNIVHGGFQYNVVPDRCSITVDIRFLPGMTIKDILHDVERVLDELRAQDPFLGGLDVSYKILSISRPVFTDPEEPLVKLMSRVITDVTKVVPKPEGMVASSDARWIAIDAKIPTVCFSMGNASGHGPNEYIILDQYIENIKIYAQAALMILD